MYSIGTLTAGLIIGIMGNQFDRYGHRIMTTIVAISLGLACLEMSFVQNLGMLFVGFFLIRLLGQGSMSLSSSTLVPQWFDAKKGRALSIASLGSAFASALLPPLNTWLIQTYGWRFGWRFWSALLWCIMTPAAFIVIRDRAEDVGLWPDNQKYANQPTLRARNTEAIPPYEVWTVKETIRTRSFWLLLFCMSIPSAIATGLIFHQVSVMKKVGLPPQVAALVLSIMAMVSLPMMLVSGPVADKVPGRYLMAFSQGLLLVSMITLLKANSTLLAMVYGVLMGIMMGMATQLTDYTLILNIIQM